MSHSYILSEIDQHLELSTRRMLDSRASLGASLFSPDSEYDLRESTPGTHAPSYRSSPVRSEYVTESEAESDTPWSPPGWRKSASGLYSTRGCTISPSWSRGPSPLLPNRETFSELEVARAVPLPAPRDTPYETPQPHSEALHSRYPSAGLPKGRDRIRERSAAAQESDKPQRGCKSTRVNSECYASRRLIFF